MRPGRTARGLREEAPIVADRQLSTGHLHDAHAQPVQDDQPTTAFLSAWHQVQAVREDKRAQIKPISVEARSPGDTHDETGRTAMFLRAVQRVGRIKYSGTKGQQQQQQQQQRRILRAYSIGTREHDEPRRRPCRRRERPTAENTPMAVILIVFGSQGRRGTTLPQYETATIYSAGASLCRQTRA